MILDSGIVDSFKDILTKSSAEGLETGSFGLYIPTEDRLVMIVEPNDLPDQAIVKQQVSKVVYAQELLENIKAYNEGSSPILSIGSALFVAEGKIIGYHTHPILDQEIAPSTDDRDGMNQIASPVEIILAAGLQQYRPDAPFVAGYREQPSNFKFPKEIPVNSFVILSRELRIDPDHVAQLCMSNKQTGLYSSLDFQIE
jgi:hypothetical protein